MSSGKVLLGVLAGVAVGATLGILFAPDKGSNTRKKISQKSDDYADELEAKFHEFITEVTKQFETVKEQGAQMIASGEAQLNHAEVKATSVVS